MKPLKTAFLITLVTFFVSVITVSNSYSLERYENSECTEPKEMIHGLLFFFLVLEVDGIADRRQSLGVPALDYDGPWPPLEKSFEGSNYGIWSVSDKLVCQQLQQFIDDNDTPDTLSKYYYQTETHYFIFYTGRSPNMLSHGGKPHIFAFDSELNYLGRGRG